MDMICPVCSSKVKQISEGNLSCAKCSFKYAHVKMWAGSNSRSAWDKKVKGAHDTFLSNKINTYALSDLFILGTDKVGIIDAASESLLMFDAYGDITKKGRVAQASVNERNVAVVYEDGRVEVEGDNIYGQCRIRNPINAAHVLCAPNCTYVVYKDGHIEAAGLVIDPQITSWKNIIKMDCGNNHIVGLTGNGTVLIAGDNIDDKVKSKVAKWTNVQTVRAAADCTVALFANGTVGFAGGSDDTRADAEKWTDIVDVIVESRYVVGLDSKGSVHMAGNCSKFLDRNRSTAAQWKDIVAIACSDSGIAGITLDGKLQVVGSFSGEIDAIMGNWLKTVEV